MVHILGLDMCSRVIKSLWPRRARRFCPVPIIAALHQRASFPPLPVGHSCLFLILSHLRCTVCVTRRRPSVSSLPRGSKPPRILSLISLSISSSLPFAIYRPLRSTTLDVRTQSCPSPVVVPRVIHRVSLFAGRAAGKSSKKIEWFVRVGVNDPQTEWWTNARFYFWQ